MTIVVMPGDGREARRFRWSRGRTFASVLALILALGLSAVSGYQLGRAQRSGPANDTAPVAEEATSTTSVTQKAQLVATAHATPSQTAKSQHEEKEVISPLEPGPVLLVMLPDSDEPQELHPLSTDGQPMEKDHELLRNALACRGKIPETLDPQLVQALTQLYAHFDRPVELMENSCANHGDENSSQEHHSAGRAADIRLRGVSTAKLAAWLQEQQLGGVGRYKKKGFVHLDVRGGGPMYWEPNDSSGEDQQEIQKTAVRATPPAVDRPPQDNATSEEAHSVHQQPQPEPLADAQETQAATSTAVPEP